MEGTRIEIIALLQDLEERYPVNSWTYKGRKIWPFLRIHLFFQWLKQRRQSKSTGKGEGKLSILIQVIRGLPILLRIYLEKGKAGKLFCGATHFRHLNKGRYQTRYFNQLMAEARENKEGFLFLEYESTAPDYVSRTDHPRHTLHFHLLAPLLHLWKKMRISMNPPKIEGTESLLAMFQEVEFRAKENYAYGLQELHRDLVYMDIVRKLYKRVLRNHQVQQVYMLCYYSRMMFPMVMACRDLKIHSVDIQHGGQGEAHMAYAGFRQVPREGYEMLPKEFWCWTEGSGSVLRKWIRNQEYHTVSVKGNPWLEYQRDLCGEELKESRKIILLTMQPDGEALIEPYILEAIAETPETYIWWLRLHPRQLDRKQELLRLIEENGLEDKVNIEEAQVYSLPFLINRCHVHISKYSGSILEAFLLHKRNIIISEMGAEMFPEVAVSPLGSVVTQKDSAPLLSAIRIPEEQIKRSKTRE